MREKFFLAILQTDRVNDGFPLQALEPLFDDGPFGTVDHDRNAADLRLASDQMQEVAHGCFGIEHSFVHVDVENVRATANLLSRDNERTLEVAAQDQLRKFWRARDVGSFADDNKAELRCDVERLEPGKAEDFRISNFDCRLLLLSSLCSSSDVAAVEAAL